MNVTSLNAVHCVMVCAVHIPAINYQQYEEEKPTHQNTTRPKRGSKQYSYVMTEYTRTCCRKF
jgi:hypothetical protein